MNRNNVDIHNSTNWRLNRIGENLRDRHTRLPFLLLLLAYISVDQWSPVKLGNTAILWLLAVIIFYELYKVKKNLRLSINAKPYSIILLFFIWAGFSSIRGLFVADNYWEYKNLISGIFIIFMPYCVYAFSNPNILKYVLRTYFVYGSIAFVVWFFWMVGFSQFYLGPFYMIICFLPIINNKFWHWWILGIAMGLMLSNPIDNRSQFLKVIASLLLALAYVFRGFYSEKTLRVIHWFFYGLPIVLLFLGITGVYNIFVDTNKTYAKQYQTSSGSSGEIVDATDDTRTFIYYETITSAVRNDYVLFGRTPARGNDTMHFWDSIEGQNEQHKVENLKYERHRNEVCFPNFFTWLGLVGLILYSLIYLTASYVGLYHSKSLYVKLMAIYTAFNFMFGWVENCCAFDILNFNYWFMISICLSPLFRNMTDKDINNWIQELFPVSHNRLYK